MMRRSTDWTQRCANEHKSAQGALVVKVLRVLVIVIEH